MNIEKANKLKSIAKRTIKIIDLILKGVHPTEIATKTKSDRSLVEYYRKILK